MFDPDFGVYGFWTMFYEIGEISQRESEEERVIQVFY